MSKYVIIDAEAIRKTIKELEEEYKSEPAYQFSTYGDKLIKEIMILKQILSQSTPLIPEIEKAFDESWFKAHAVTANKVREKQDYISNLKLDI